MLIEGVIISDIVYEVIKKYYVNSIISAVLVSRYNQIIQITT